MLPEMSSKWRCLWIQVLSVMALVMLVQTSYTLWTRTSTSQPVEKIKKTSSPAPVVFDPLKFEINVIKPYKEIVKKFPKHPDMIIRKLLRNLDHQEQQIDSLQKRINQFRSWASSATSNSWFGLRKLLSARLRPCPDLDESRLQIHEDKVMQDVSMGGYYRPRHCDALMKVGVLVTAGWEVQMERLHLALQERNLEYRVFVIHIYNHSSSSPKNEEAALTFAANHLVNKMDHYDCLVMINQDMDNLDEQVLKCGQSGLADQNNNRMPGVDVSPAMQQQQHPWFTILWLDQARASPEASWAASLASSSPGVARPATPTET